MSHSLPNILSKEPVRYGVRLRPLQQLLLLLQINVLKLVPDISPGSVTVKWKYKTLNGTGRVVTKWWFILRGEEVLQALENKWNIIAVQTAWRTEPVFYGSTASNTTSNAVMFAPSDNPAMITALNQKPVVTLQTTPPVLATCGTQSIDETNHPLTLIPSWHERETS